MAANASLNIVRQVPVTEQGSTLGKPAPPRELKQRGPGLSGRPGAGEPLARWRQMLTAAVVFASSTFPAGALDAKLVPGVGATEEGTGGQPSSSSPNVSCHQKAVWDTPQDLLARGSVEGAASDELGALQSASGLKSEESNGAASPAMQVGSRSPRHAGGKNDADAKAKKHEEALNTAIPQSTVEMFTIAPALVSEVPLPSQPLLSQEVPNRTPLSISAPAQRRGFSGALPNSPGGPASLHNAGVAHHTASSPLTARAKPAAVGSDLAPAPQTDSTERTNDDCEMTAAAQPQKPDLSVNPNEDRRPASVDPDLASASPGSDKHLSTAPPLRARQSSSPLTALPNTATAERELAIRKDLSRVDEAKQARTSDSLPQTIHIGPRAHVEVRAASSQSVDAGTMRDSTAVVTPGTRGAADDPAASLLSPSGSSGRDLFIAMDADRSSETPHWVHVGARQAEAGFQDPEMGWVAVRAHSAADGVHAALIPSSTDAARSLADHLNGLNAHLSTQHTPVQSVTLSWEGQALGQSLDHGAGHDNAQQRQSGADAVSDASAESISCLTGAAEATGGSDLQDFEPDGSRYISVIA